MAQVPTKICRSCSKKTSTSFKPRMAIWPAVRVALRLRIASFPSNGMFVSLSTPSPIPSNSLGRYAVHFLESVNTENQESIEAMNEEADTRQQEWELENIKRMKDEEEERMSEEEDRLYYEVVS